MDFDAVVTFGPNIEMEQTPRDVFLVMEANQELYQRYITEFVWNAAPEGTQFGETREVSRNAKIVHPLMLTYKLARKSLLTLCFFHFSVAIGNV